MKKLTAILFLFLLNAFLFGQDKKACDKIYDKPDTLAKYGTDNKALRQYVQNKIIPILGDCIKQKMEFVNSMTIKFTIDMNGNVLSVDFLKPALSDYCSGKLRAEILIMKGWQPGKIKDKHVCSYFIYPIAGIKWE